MTMCKLAVFTNITKLRKKQLERLVDAVTYPMISTEQDGIGIAYNTDKGLYAERWLDPWEFLARNAVFPERSKLAEAPEVLRTGYPGKAIGGLLVHGRTSTNTTSLECTHPFMNKDYALVHNGVVYNDGPELKCKTDNDTEYLLHRYTSGGIQDVAKTLSGYYACGVLDLKNNRTIVFRDSTARLMVSWFEKYQTYVFATTTDIIDAAAKSLRVDDYVIQHAKKNFHAVFDASSGLLSTDTFEPMSRSFGYLDRKSLGYDFYDGYAGDGWGTDPEDYITTDDAEPDVIYVKKDGTQLTTEEYDMLPRREQEMCEPVQCYATDKTTQ